MRIHSQIIAVPLSAALLTFMVVACGPGDGASNKSNPVTTQRVGEGDSAPQPAGDAHSEIRGDAAASRPSATALNPQNVPWFAAEWCHAWAGGQRQSAYPAAGPDPDPNATFYAQFEGLYDGALVLALARKIDNHRVMGYDTSRTFMVEQLDCQDGWLTGVYTGMLRRTSCHVPDNDVINTEHTWPKSEMVGSDEQEGSKSDLHHLFPTQHRANSIRGSLPFGHPLWQLQEVYAETGVPALQSGARRGLDDGGNRLFESRTEHKGDAARAMFYYATRYDRAIDAAQEAVLRCWNGLDPPDDAERARNDAIATEGRQGLHNRNPFVDHPEYVDLIADF